MSAPAKNFYGHEKRAWESAKSEAMKALRARARQETWIAYSELSRAIVSISFQPDGHDFHAMLGELSEESNAAGMGMISALVVHKDGDRLPGPGFFTLAKQLGRNTSDRVKCWSDEVALVFSRAE